MKAVIGKELGNKFRPYLWLESSEGIPDNRELKLVILHPEDPGSHIKEWMERKGNNFREYKNTLFFALADLAGFGKLREDIKTSLALQEIQEEIRSGENPLLEGKREEVDRRMREITRDYSYSVRRMYHVLRYGDTNGGRTLDLGQPVTGKENLDAWFWRELTSGDVGAILTQLHYRTIINKFLVNNEQIPTGLLLDQFYKNPELPALESQGVLARAIQLGVQDGAFGLAALQGGEIVSSSLKYKAGLTLDAIPLDQDTLLLTSARCEAIMAQLREKEETLVDIAVQSSNQGQRSGRATLIVDQGASTSEQPAVHHRVQLIIGDIPASKIADVNRGILLPFIRAVGDFKFVIEIDLNSDEGISQAVLENQIKETIRQIGARIISEEKD